MENPYRPPNAELEGSAELSSGVPPYKLYKVAGIGWATFFTSMLAGGTLMALNYRRLGRHALATKTLWLTGIGMFAILTLAVMMPDHWNVPNLAYTLPQLLVMVELARRHQGSILTQHVARGGALASNWAAIGIGLLVLLGFLAVVIPLVFLYYYLAEPAGYLSGPVGISR